MGSVDDTTVELLPLAASEVPAAPVLALMAFGVLLALVGHASRSTALVATGLAILFLATAAMVAGGFIAFNDDPTDPRDQPNVREPRF
jgi:hypothetical protein